VSKKYHDPVTGDELSWLEYYTRQVQVVVRTPWFILFFNVITLVAMILGHGDVWNYFASWLAIIVEWLVGTYMFGQTGRDALYIRRIAHLEEVNDKQLKHLEALVEAHRLNPPGGGQDSLHREAPEAPERGPDQAAPTQVEALQNIARTTVLLAGRQ
jgi:hypothetical protein